MHCGTRNQCDCKGKTQNNWFFRDNWVVNKKRRAFVITEYREWDLFTVSMVTGENAGHRIIKKCKMRQKLNLTYLFEKFYQSWANISWFLLEFLHHVYLYSKKYPYHPPVKTLPYLPCAPLTMLVTSRLTKFRPMSRSMQLHYISFTVFS